jgi:hypothetical protein
MSNQNREPQVTRFTGAERSMQMAIQQVSGTAMDFAGIPGTALDVSRVAIGTWAIGGWMWGGTDEAESVATIRAAVEHGINLIDTAPVYGFGNSEEIVGKAIGEGQPALTSDPKLTPPPINLPGDNIQSPRHRADRSARRKRFGNDRTLLIIAPAPAPLRARNHFHAAHRTVSCTSANDILCTSAKTRPIKSPRARRPLPDGYVLSRRQRGERLQPTWLRVRQGISLHLRAA